MLSDKMVKSINDQINKEIYSGYLYLGMASYAAQAGLPGVANWFTVQMQEELAHAQKFYDYVNRQGGRVLLKSVDEPPQKFSSPLELFKKTLAHEKIVTGLINKLVDQARAEKDHATEIFLQWFVTEQVEEEENATSNMNRLKLTGQDGNGLLMIDKELAARVFTPPPAAK
ncbi:MAG: ferritin [Candidatus Omnitrophica bacterium]|nr:ferritin [Candidatus Omnitrophota bacterium]MDD5487696.1 ferritin [Candidatus Omnitrophota bacterium]